MTKEDKDWLEFQLKQIERAPEPYMYNGEIIGHPFNLSQTIDTLGKDIIPNVLGIYHLFYKDMLVYIGMSKNLRGRLMQHLKDEGKVFQNVLWFSCEDKTIEQVLNIEYNMIKTFKPSLNLTHANAR
jgi:predicted GIY-YIG superfamily endonuclease